MPTKNIVHTAISCKYES